MKRDIVFDIFKGIGIILMVAAHAIAPGKSDIYLFHMAIFFIVSGIFFKEKHYENITNVLKAFKSKCRHLFVPFVLWNGALTLLHNLFMHINIYTNNPQFLSLPMGAEFGLKEYYPPIQVAAKFLSTFLFSHFEQLGGATWFLRVLFLISVGTLLGHYILSKFVKNKRIFNIIVFFAFITSLMFGYYLQKAGFNFYGIGSTFSCAILYYLGILYNSYKNIININFSVFACSIIALFIAHHCILGQIGLGLNHYPNPLWLVVVSLSGFIFVLFISKILSRYDVAGKIFSYIGMHTISILLFHFLGFKLITYIHTVIYSEPSYYLAAFPVLTNTGFWWLAYCLAGVGLPLIFAFCWEKLQNRFKTAE